MQETLSLRCVVVDHEHAPETAPAAPANGVRAEARCLLSESKGTVYALDLAPFFQ